MPPAIGCTGKVTSQMRHHSEVRRSRRAQRRITNILSTGSQRDDPTVAILALLRQKTARCIRISPLPGWHLVCWPYGRPWCNLWREMVPAFIWPLHLRDSVMNSGRAPTGDCGTVAGGVDVLLIRLLLQSHLTPTGRSRIANGCNRCPSDKPLWLLIFPRSIIRRSPALQAAIFFGPSDCFVVERPGGLE